LVGVALPGIDAQDVGVLGDGEVDPCPDVQRVTENRDVVEVRRRQLDVVDQFRLEVEAFAKRHDRPPRTATGPRAEYRTHRPGIDGRCGGGSPLGGHVADVRRELVDAEVEAADRYARSRSSSG
jgi:hypothetical protein